MVPTGRELFKGSGHVVYVTSHGEGQYKTPHSLCVAGAYGNQLAVYSRSFCMVMYVLGRSSARQNQKQWCCQKQWGRQNQKQCCCQKQCCLSEPVLLAPELVLSSSVLKPQGRARLGVLVRCCYDTADRPWWRVMKAGRSSRPSEAEAVACQNQKQWACQNQ